MNSLLEHMETEAQVLTFQLSSSVDNLIAQSQRVEIMTDADVAKATDLIKLIKSALDTAENERVKITQPINQGLKALNSRFKEITEPLNKAYTFVAGKIKCYQMEALKRQREEQEKILEEERQRKLAEQAFLDQNKESPTPFFSPFEIENTLAIVPKSNKTISAVGNLGKSFVGEKWTFKVLDINKVPDSFTVKIINTQLVKDAIKKGVRDIEGIEIYDEGKLNLR